MPSSSILDLLLACRLDTTEPQGGNRLALEGLTIAPGAGGGQEIRIRKLEAAALRLACGAFVLEAGQLALQQVVAQVRLDADGPRLSSLQAGSAELASVALHGPLELAQQAEAALHGTWSLGPLATADGTLRAEIVDAHLLFDAQVTVPLRQGQVDFNSATVEHVGPDSRMGVSRLGVYVDAPNGRSYLYQFTAATLAGVEFERRGALLGALVSDRGRLRLQPFLEGLLRQPLAPPGHGITDQARLLFDRTALAGDVQLGDASFAAPGLQAELVGRAAGSNLVRLHSESVGRGLSAEMASLSVRHAVLKSAAAQAECQEITGSLVARAVADSRQLRFVLELANVRLAGLRVQQAG